MRDPDWDASDKDAAEHYVSALEGLKVGGGIERGLVHAVLFVGLQLELLRIQLKEGR